jgi:beta-glucanase (GH16 family)
MCNNRKSGLLSWTSLIPIFIILGFLVMMGGCDKKEDLEFTPNFSYSMVDENHVQFTNTSDGEYYSLIWNFGNGVADTTIDKKKTYVVYYPEAGNFNVKLLLTNYYGDNESSTKSVSINNTDLIVSFTMEIDDENPNYVMLTNTSQGTYDSLKWSYRSLEVENEMQFTAYFPFAGNYNVGLSVYVNNREFNNDQSLTIAQDDPNIATNLVWSDEFEYIGLPETSKWTMETGGDGWGNQELQYYTNSENNAMVDNGILTITAREESFGGRDYTSARITTQNKFDFQYGKVEARIKMPYSQGMWAAFWMLGSNINSVGWPACGEIDIVEMVGGANDDNTCFSTLHWDNGGENAAYGQSYTLNSGILADDFHIYSLQWTDQKISAYIDDILYFEIDITPAELSEFHQNFFIILNLAVGGILPGSPDETTVFDQTMEVDYVRVYQLEEQ